MVYKYEQERVVTGVIWLHFTYSSVRFSLGLVRPYTLKLDILLVRCTGASKYIILSIRESISITQIANLLQLCGALA